MMMHPQRTVYIHKSTTNQSFINMHCYLKDIGIHNNAFMLALLDPDLAGKDPHDKKLNRFMQQKVLRECLCNYWYFIRECVRIPVEGSTGVKYELHRGNLALNFCMMLNLNVFLELPRQHYKTVSALCRYLYLFNFGTSNSVISFMNKKMEDSKRNLADMKELREMLPSYLRMDMPFSMRDATKKIKMPDTVEKLQHPINKNIIKAVPSARSKVAAANLLRGQAIPILWADEWAFILYNSIIYTNAVPAFSTAMKNAKMHGVPYGILITTTPGLLTTEEGEAAYSMREAATKFDEFWYDMNYQDLMNMIEANTKSTFVHIKFTYQQLGKSEEWFAKICKEMEAKWPDIRREVLLEWSTAADNSPFSKEDLDIVARLVRDPISKIIFMKKYVMEIYDTVDRNGMFPKYPPLIGVDVSGGYKRDSSAIACVDSKTTKLFACFKSNYIAIPDLARVIYDLVTKYMPNAVINVERNGGYGAAVLAKLVNTSIKHNLYFEIKDKVIEESSDGIRTIKRSQKTKVFGLDSSKTVRGQLIDILMERMEYHKDKFIAKPIYDEMLGMEVKRNGKVEHSSNTHDDLVFAYLLALYVWYEGKNLRETFGIEKSTIKTDESIDEVMFGLEEKYSDIIEEITYMDSRVGRETQRQVHDMEKAKGKLFSEWVAEERRKDQESLDNLLSTRPGREAYARHYGIPIEEVHPSTSTYRIPDKTFNMNDDSVFTHDENDDYDDYGDYDY